ncbi:hypothetical protein C0J52_11461 [Blattella germanica]|nr:hypothetical protein C0J52_11461 [Blattella germanica]
MYIELCSLLVRDRVMYLKLSFVTAAEKKLYITWWRHESGVVNLTCNAQGVYPEPKMSLYVDSKSKSSLNDVIVQVKKSQKCFDISATKILEGRDIQTTTMFDCELRIPEANYAVRKSIVYYPATEPGGLEYFKQKPPVNSTK